MVAKGILTPQEKELLDMQMSVSKVQKHWILLEWIVFKCKEAQQRKGQRRMLLIQGQGGFEQALLEKMCALRSYCSQISNKITGRMPLAYAHYVKVLVDVFLIMAPVAQYSRMGGAFAAMSTALLSVFYSGLMDLAFGMLDPLGEEDCLESCIYLDLSLLLRETTLSSRRWINVGSKLKW
jgi:predicted membrane chloride channel (bestrophin family)